MIEKKNDLDKSSSSNLVFLRENHFQRDSVAISPQNWLWTLKMPYFYRLISKSDWKLGKNRYVGLTST